MLSYQLKTYNPEKKITGFHFYILNKGNNSGKPMLSPCPNSFVCICKTEKEKEQLYWLIFGLWQGKTFQVNLLGSVIPYIRKKDLSETLEKGISKFISNPEKAQKNITSIHQLEKQRQTILKQFQLMQQLKLALIQEVLK
ncbi:MAG: hypothetical protein HYR91_04055 [Flavobacteriia bacterium]|nr:hypothetical protein [Flavobacteriia bacterium]